VIVDTGDLGKEPGIYVLGRTPLEAVRKVIDIYEGWRRQSLG